MLYRDLSVLFIRLDKAWELFHRIREQSEFMNLKEQEQWSRKLIQSRRRISGLTRRIRVLTEETP